MTQRLKRIFVTPFEKFVQIESFSGILLFAVTIISLIWANSSFGDTYEAFWHYEIGVGLGDYMYTKSLTHWINDGLMVVFFFLIGLEIKREILLGELNTLRKASLPIFAALGGVLVPVFLFLLLNDNPETAKGWGIPMATDIAFTLAILKILGKRIPLSLIIFLTAFAIVDDLAAVLAIAVFYSTGINWSLILLALIPYGLLLFLSYKKYYNEYLYFFFAFIIWVMFLKSGIHPTIAGILMAFTIPIRQKIALNENTDEIHEIVDSLVKAPSKDVPILSEGQISHIDDMQGWITRVQSPLQALEHRLHGWVAYFVIPIFALANAGVAFNDTANMDMALGLNLVLALILGKCIGVFLFSFIGVKLRWADLPKGVGFKQIFGVGLLAGVGFTMSVFIAGLAFNDTPELINSSKVGILIASFLAGLLGYIVLRITSKQKNKPE